MTVVLLALVASFASAADSNEDGCEDSYFDANGACVAESAVIGSGATVGTDAHVGPLANIGTDTSLQADAFVGARSVLVGRSGLSGARVVGTGTVIGRSVFIDADHSIGADNTIGRSVSAGERLETGANVAIGFASTIGDDVTLGAGAIVGSLVGVGANTQVEPSATLARGVSISDSTTAGTIGGLIGPSVSIGSDNTIATTARIRKNATLGNEVTVLGNARIARNVTIADGVTVGANARIGPGATVTATTVVPDGHVIPRGETYDDPTAGDFVGGTLLDSAVRAQINGWVGDPNAEWTLCYKRSVNGASSNTFHSLCDGYPNTVAVLTLPTGKKIGGYTPIAWAANNSYSAEGTNSSFLFSLTNDYKHSTVRSTHHTYRGPGHGTTFGGGHDLYINGSMSVGYCAVSFSYGCRPGYSGNSCRTDFCGSTGGVTPTDYEVYYRTN
jgi:UDP-3-O-[3-hydroxymyristoyl] glucosamine N-acyltransferase